MKKLFSLILISAFCLSLCACSLIPDAEVVYVPAESEATAEAGIASDSTASENDAADAEAAETLCGIMEDMYENYHPGTAGSSLTLAAFAGRMLDWYELRGSVGAISKAAAAFAAVHEDYAAVDSNSEISVGFPAVLAEVWRCAADMSFPGGDEVLESAGYARSTDWDPAHTEVFFTQLFAAFGLQESASVRLYYGRSLSVKYPAETDEYSLMSALRAAGVIDYETQLTSFTHDGDHLALDFGSELVTMLNGLDVDGEHTALSCIANTFLDAFGAESITFTVDGNALSTEKSSYDYAIGRDDL